ncbi:hypothetical protein DFH09DRAFT_916173 [Mycena vulgaris]|nr:hypothetical protein DFH09DRAFT_916173 [Mycena vulgaris]
MHWCSSRLRTDQGVENIEVAIYIEELNGSGRASFFWGRSAHNTRIERLWYDVTHRFSKKWKVFFFELETNRGLNPTRPVHIWLLHHFFLVSVNRDAQEWAEAWNSHQLTIRRQREHSPRDLFVFGMLREGPRGISSFLAPEEEDFEDISKSRRPERITHLLESNPHKRPQPNNDPFAPSSTPANLSEVLCEPPNCPFIPAQI